MHGDLGDDTLNAGFEGGILYCGDGDDSMTGAHFGLGGADDD